MFKAIETPLIKLRLFGPPRYVNFALPECHTPEGCSPRNHDRCPTMDMYQTFALCATLITVVKMICITAVDVAKIVGPKR